MQRLGLVAAAALPFIASGCVALLPMTSAPPSRAPEAPSDLRTMIMATGASYDESLAFQVNRAAYAAVFRIIPGQGAQMIYPRPGYGSRDGFLFSGFYRVAAGEGGSFMSGPYGAGLPTRAAVRGTGSEAGPEYYFAVVSEEPLRLDGSMYGVDSWLRSERGGPDMMSWIASQIVARPAGSEWTTDYYVHWPQAISTVDRSGFVAVTCDGKRFWASPAMHDRAVSFFCGDGSVSQSEGTRPQPAGAAGTSDEVVEPQRREALPAVSGRITSRQLQEPEMWEEARSVLASARRAALPVDLLPGSGPLGAAERMELERMLFDLERAGASRDPLDPTSDFPARMRPVGTPGEGVLTRPGSYEPRLRPTFEVPDPSPPPGLETWGDVPPSPDPIPVPVERVPTDGSGGEGVSRRRPTIE